MFEAISDLRFGQILEVSGTTARVELAGDMGELTRSYQGRVYYMGQIGSIVKIHMGRRLVFGFVSMLRMRSDENVDESEESIAAVDSDQRIMDIELFAEGVWHSSEMRLEFRRGVQRYPLPRQGVYLLTNAESGVLYRAAEGAAPGEDGNLVHFGSYAGEEGTQCRANVDRMFALHAAILGSTGAGKSGTVAALIHSMLEHHGAGGESVQPRIVMIDPHGEYSTAFGSRATVYRAYDPIGMEAIPHQDIRLPYWLMSGDEFRRLVIGKTEYEATSQNNIVYKALIHARMVSAGLVEEAPRKYEVLAPQDGREFDEPRLKDGADEDLFRSFDRDKPRPFSLAEFSAHIEFMQAARIKKDGMSERVPQGDFSKNFASILDKLAVLRRDPRVQFLMREWEPGGDASLAEVIAQFVGEQIGDDNVSRDIRVIDISGLPNEVAGPLSAAVARLLFQYKLFETEEEKRRDPVVLVCEEAHRYVPQHGEAQYAAAQASIRRIAREGRKYGVGLLLVSQRPADVEGTVISQCGTWIVMRLTNSVDQDHVARFLPDSVRGMTRILPALGQQEALFVGEAAALPSRIRVRDLEKSRLPRSNAVPFVAGWQRERLSLGEIGAVAGRMDGTNKG